jgi:hypothetical protein
MAVLRDVKQNRDLLGCPAQLGILFVGSRAGGGLGLSISSDERLCWVIMVAKRIGGEETGMHDDGVQGRDMKLER